MGCFVDKEIPGGDCYDVGVQVSSPTPPHTDADVELPVGGPIVRQLRGSNR